LRNLRRPSVGKTAPEKQREYNRRWREKRDPEKKALANAKSCAAKHADPNYSERHVRNLMISRCYRKTDPRYHRYGGRGITVCDRWRESFDNFLADMGKRPKGYVIDRVDNDGPYSPDNCRWVTWKESAKNMTFPIRTVFAENRQLKEDLAKARAAEELLRVDLALNREIAEMRKNERDEQRAETESLRAKIANEDRVYLHVLERYDEERDQLRAERNWSLADRVRTLADALALYGQHKPMCQSFEAPHLACSCGWNIAAAALDAGRKEEK
jgi:hypothetical protein